MDSGLDDPFTAFTGDEAGRDDPLAAVGLDAFVVDRSKAVTGVRPEACLIPAPACRGRCQRPPP